MSAVIIPFGKHKGRTVEEVEIADPQYLQFLEQQDWMREKFPSILAAAAALRGAEHESTPEHNALQMRFLEPDFCRGLAHVLYPDNKFLSSDVSFEAGAGWDAQLRLDFWHYWANLSPGRAGPKQYRNESGSPIRVSFRIGIEAKVWLGDEYPSVLRQIRRQSERQDLTRSTEYSRHTRLYAHLDKVVLLTRGIRTAAVSDAQVRAFFAAAGVRVITEAEIAAAPLHYFVPKRRPPLK